MAEVFGDLAAAGHVSVIVPGSDIDLLPPSTGPRTPTAPRRAWPARCATAPGAPHRGRRVGGIHHACRPRTRRRHRPARRGRRTAAGPLRPGPDGRRRAASRSVLPQLRLGGLWARRRPAGPRPTSWCSAPPVCARTRGRAAHQGPRLGGAGRQRLDRPRAERRAAGLGHGADPTDAAFGARRIPADDAEGHTGYFAPGTDSLRAFTPSPRGGDVDEYRAPVPATRRMARVEGACHRRADTGPPRPGHRRTARAGAARRAHRPLAARRLHPRRRGRAAQRQPAVLLRLASPRSVGCCRCSASSSWSAATPRALPTAATEAGEPTVLAARPAGPPGPPGARGDGGMRRC